MSLKTIKNSTRIKRLRALFLFLSFYLISFSNGFAQQTAQILNKEVSVVSPEAASIPLYSQYPVDHVSGVPNIEIPLFEFPSALGPIPFKLSYHVGKVKPSELSGIAGWGWSLTPNIGIVRSINGAEDSATGGFPANSYLHGNSSYQNNRNYLAAAALETLDEQPDDFFYSLIDKNGQFLYNNSGGFTTIPFEPIVITRGDNLSFTITDDKGNRYVFGKFPDTGQAILEYSNPSQDIPRLVSWKIRAIIPYGNTDTLKFEYGLPKISRQIPYYNFVQKVVEFPNEYNIFSERKPTQVYLAHYGEGSPNLIGYQTMYPRSREYVPSYGYNNFAAGFDVFFNSIAPLSPLMTMVTGKYNSGINDADFGTSHSSEEVYSYQHSDQQLLTGVRSKDCRMELIYDSGRLVRLRIYSSAEALLKEINLYQSQMGTISESQPLGLGDISGKNKRYCLDSVEFSDGANVVERFRLNYRNFSQSSKKTFHVNVNRFSDFWGFYHSGSHVIPRMPFYADNFSYPSEITVPEDTPAPYGGSLLRQNVYLLIGGQVESTMPVNLPEGLLKTIQYPTGGSAEFLFENNRYRGSAIDEKIVYGAGYRIKSIKYRSAAGQDSLLKEYKYGENEDGIGKLRYKLYDYNFISQQYIKKPNPFNGMSILEKVTTIKSKPHLGLSFGNGAPILYSMVTEYSINYNGNVPMGKTEYRYFISPANHTNFIPNTPLQAEYRDSWTEYKAESVTNYAYESGLFRKINKTSYGYTTYPKESIRVAATFRQYIDLYSNNPNDIPPVTEFARLTYSIPTGAVRLTHTADSTFDGHTISKISSMDYHANTLYRKSTSSTSSEGKSEEESVLYISDAAQAVTSVPFQSNQSDMLGNLVASNRIFEPLQIQNKVAQQVTSILRKEFGTFNGRIYPRTIWKSYSGAAFRKEIDYINYDQGGNIVEVKKRGGPNTVYLWGYKGLYPVAKIDNATYTEVKAALNDVSGVFVDQLRVKTAPAETDLLRLKGLRNIGKAEVSTYAYTPLVGMTSLTDPRGLTETYEYDSYGRLMLVKDHDGNILRAYCYNVAGQRIDCSSVESFSNVAASRTFWKNNCPAGQQGGTVIYTVPAGRYSSTVSQVAADQLAQNEITTMGQAYANQNGTCTPLSNCTSYRIRIPSSVIQANNGNMFIGFADCASGMQQVVSIHTLEAYPDDNCLDCWVTEICAHNSFPISFHYNQYGGAVFLPDVEIEIVGDCN